MYIYMISSRLLERMVHQTKINTWNIYDPFHMAMTADGYVIFMLMTKF